MNRARVDQIAIDLALKKGWSVPRYIDAGNSAAVYEVDCPARGKVALKIYDPSFFDGENALIEKQRVELQRKIQGHGNPHLIEVLEAEEIPEAGTWYILMEFCPWPSLDKKISEIPDENILPLIRQLAQAVMFLDENGLVHRDIKPANIVVSPDFLNLKLLDLGVMRKIARDEGNGTDVAEKRRFIATAQYSPPEYLLREEDRGEEGFKAINIYQVGAVLHDLIMKRAIFADEAATQNRYILSRAVADSVPRLRNVNVPAQLLAMCRAALDKDANRRIRAVALGDFCGQIDSAEAIRRRIAAISATAATVVRPPLVVWRPRVDHWIRSAARLESQALGPLRLRLVAQAPSAQWRLTFRKIGRDMLVLLNPADHAALSLRLVIEEPIEVSLEILEVDTDGPGMNEEEVVQTIAHHILYLLDLASEPTDTPDSPTTSVPDR